MHEFTIPYYPLCGQLLGQIVCEADEVLFACQEPIGLMGAPPLWYSPSIEDCDGNSTMLRNLILCL